MTIASIENTEEICKKYNPRSELLAQGLPDLH